MKIIFLLLLIFPFTFSQNISTHRIETIIDLLIKDSIGISNYIFPAELQISNRFGIEYDEIRNKFLIANDIPKELSNDLLTRKTKCNYKLENLENNFSLLTFKIPSLNIKREYFLKDSSLVSTAYYYSQNWEVIISDYFKFYVSDKTLFNQYSITQLEGFVKRMVETLLFTEEEINCLKEDKIFYFLCKDVDEIKKVTGFETRGIYIIAQDYVVTTYNIHYHELLHFLINYKLKKLPLYTHPFLQEGFAVAYGGRGGLEANTISEMGVFLVKSSFANYSELLNKSGFYKTDASISYPISGLYTSFLIENFGIDYYLSLYKKYSGSSENDLLAIINKNDILPDERWYMFIDSLSTLNPIIIVEDSRHADYKLITQQNNFEVYGNESEYFFRIKDTLLIKTSKNIPNYQSKIFKQNFPERKYNSEKYLIIANQNEISVYNLFSNSLVGKYVVSFSLPPLAVPAKDGFYEFVIEKDLFDEVLEVTNIQY